MKYTVVWTTTAENELAQIWLDASDRQQVSDAANRLERELKRDPIRSSTIRSDYFREMYLQPLVVRFNISEDDRRVTVVSITRRN